MSNSSEQKTVLETILTWSESRPDWLRDALRRIVSSGTPGNEDLEELLALCKKEHGDDTVELDAVPLTSDHLPVDPGAGESIAISSIQNVAGVNQLARDQTLNLEPNGLSIIYGPNGTGKSGYTRILKKACRARHAGDIMPDVFNPSPTGNATAVLSIVKSDGNSPDIEWEDNDNPIGALSAITVFDRDSGSVHVQKKNEVWFRPFGLDIPDDLAGTCQALKARCEQEEQTIEAQRNDIFSNPTWSPETTVGKILSNLKSDTDLAPLRAVPKFTKEDDATLAQLTADLAQDSAVAANQQSRNAQAIDGALSQIKVVGQSCSDEILNRIITLSNTARTQREAASIAATDAFGGLKIAGVGEETWQSLWESARAYSESLDEQGPSFPPAKGDTCVLCHQTIEQDAEDRMSKFEKFIKGDTETKAATSERQRDIAQMELSETTVHISSVSIAYRFLRDSHRDLAKSLLRFYAISRLRQRQCLLALVEGSQPTLTPLPPAPIKELETIAEETRNYARSLRASEEGPERLALEKQKLELFDQKQEESLLKVAQTEVSRLKRLDLIRRCKDDMNTTAITRLGNMIADDVITPKMRDRFQEEIVALAGNRVRVEVVRSGGKFGSPQYEVKLFASPKAKVHDVLSEGEQTCVALASYLTELANTTHTSALVFDDPVTSLDHRWRANVAKRLVREAAVRQVVVFTHDMIFVNDLHSRAIEARLPIGLGHLSRSGEAVGYVNEDLPWRASGVRQRIDQLERAARAARRQFDNNEDEKYREAVAKLYSNLRSAWERALEDIVFADVIKRHRDYINTRGLKRVTALEEDDVEVFSENFSKCSDFIEGHDPSRGRDIEPPEPDELAADVETLRTWSTSLRTKMNAVT